MTTAYTKTGTTTGPSTTGCSTGSATATCSDITTGTTFSVNEITTPGCYVCNWNGSLLRVNENSFDSSGNTYFTFSSNETLTVTYLSENPYSAIGECRTTAKNCGVSFNF